MATVTLAPFANSPSPQVIVLADSLQSILAETKLTPSGSSLVSVTPVASEGPSFVTTKVL